MNDPIKTYQEYQEGRSAYFASKGVSQYNAFLSNKLTFYAFENNHRELMHHVKRHYELRLNGKLGDWNNKTPLHVFRR
jgi:hypothetical protein